MSVTLRLDSVDVDVLSEPMRCASCFIDRALSVDMLERKNGTIRLLVDKVPDYVWIYLICILHGQIDWRACKLIREEAKMIFTAIDFSLPDSSKKEGQTLSRLASVCAHIVVLENWDESVTRAAISLLDKKLLDTVSPVNENTAALPVDRNRSRASASVGILNDELDNDWGVMSHCHGGRPLVSIIQSFPLSQKMIQYPKAKITGFDGCENRIIWGCG